MTHEECKAQILAREAATAEQQAAALGGEPVVVAEVMSEYGDTGRMLFRRTDLSKLAVGTELIDRAHVARLVAAAAQSEQDYQDVVGTIELRDFEIQKLKRRIAEMEAGQQGVAVGQWSDDGFSWCDGSERELASARESGWKTRTLYTHAQPATAKVVLPERKPAEWRGISATFARGWNACLDEVAKLNTPQ